MDIMGIMNDWGYVGVFLLIAVENIFPPIPSEVILIGGGGLLTVAASHGKLSVLGMIIAATLGSVAGAIALYYIGKILKTERLKKLVRGKVGKVLRLKEADIDKADKWFDTKGNITVFFCRCVPILRSLISIPAGMSEMPMVKFLIYTAVGSAIWNTVLVALGHNLGSNWEFILGFFDQFQTVIMVICIIVFVAAMIWWFGFYRRGKIKKAKQLAAADNDRGGKKGP